MLHKILPDTCTYGTLWSMETSTILFAFGLTIFAGMATGVGSLMSFFSKKFNPKFLAGALGFSAGVMMPMGFEFGFRRSLHVVKTRPADWEETSIDLTGYIREVNKIKAGHPVFREDGLTEVLQHDNRRVLLMWKACAHDREECLLVLSKDIHGRQHFHADRLQDCVQSGSPLVDVSPSSRLSYIPAPFSYELLPGQGIVLIASSDLLHGL